MKLIIAEKGSVRDDIANVIGANASKKTKNGITYREGNGYIVANALGHLYGIGDPNDYGMVEWSIETLPLVPEFQLFPTKSSEDKFNKMLVAQRNALQELIFRPDVDMLINGCDAGREGEAIFGYIYKSLNCTKPYKRLWINSFTENDILDGMKHLKDSSETTNMYVSALTRAKADWIWGMSLSRLYSIYYNSKQQIGRVKTPTLNLIVQRYLQYVNHAKEKYYKVYMTNGAEWYSDAADEKNIISSFSNKSEAEAMASHCSNKTVKVLKAETTEKQTKPPQLFDLSDIQSAANKRYKMTAKQTAAACQALYEAHLTSYPRTETVWLPESMVDEAKKLLDILKDYNSNVSASVLQVDGNNKRIFDTSKISDHYAIVPTYEIYTIKKDNFQIAALFEKKKIRLAARLTIQNVQNIFNLILERFITAFAPPYTYDQSQYIFEIENEKFRLNINKTLKPGFKSLFTENDDKTNDEPQGKALTKEYKTGDTFNSLFLTIKEGETKPLPLYNDDTIIETMKNIDKKVENKELREYVKARGLGTTATRADILDELLKAEYVQYTKNFSFVPTEKGLGIINAVPEMVKSVDLSAEWEQVLNGIENGTSSASAAEEMINDMVNKIIIIIELEGGKEHTPIISSMGKCPWCSSGEIIETKNTFTCDKKCGFELWKYNPCDKYVRFSLTAKMMKALLKDNILVLDGFVAKNGSTYKNAYILSDYTNSKGKKCANIKWRGYASDVAKDIKPTVKLKTTDFKPYIEKGV